MRLRFFAGGDGPVYTYTSPPFDTSSSFGYSGQDLLQALKLSSFEGQVEVTVRRLDRSPGQLLFADCWFEFSSDDDSFSGSVPGSLFKGGITKRMVSGKWQHWPGVIADDLFFTSLLLLTTTPDRSACGWTCLRHRVRVGVRQPSKSAR